MTSTAQLDKNFRRDSLDLRDRIYQPALITLPNQVLPKETLITIRNQGKEGSCTGFAMAGMINYLNRSRGVDEPVSPRMLYEMAKRHDQWPGESYEGSSLRGAMKGWHKNGVCPESVWPYKPHNAGFLTKEAQKTALKFPLGAYYRVQHRRSDFHAALAEGKLNDSNVIVASAAIHQGWFAPANGIIPYSPETATEGGHAFVVVGYTDKGFLVQNSWDKDWGGIKIENTLYEGVALWLYEDFEANLWDAWIARMALPVDSLTSLQPSRFTDRGGSSKIVEKAPPRHTISNHYFHFDDGLLDPRGNYPSTRAEVTDILDTVFSDRPPKHILFYAHGGLNTINGTAKRVQAWNPVFHDNDIHEFHFMWETGFVAELYDLLGGKRKTVEQRAGGFGDWWDKAIERATQPLGFALWKEMQDDATRAFEKSKDGTWFLNQFKEKMTNLAPEKRPKLHLVGHSAGSIWLAHMLHRWQVMEGPSFDNLILYAPACTHDLYGSHILPALSKGFVRKLSTFILDKEAELDDNVAQIYRKSLLWLVSRSYQHRKKSVPIMGMEHYLDKLPQSDEANVIPPYNTRDHKDKTRNQGHGGFDNDKTTMNSMLRIVLGQDFGSNLAHGFENKHLKGY